MPITDTLSGGVSNSSDFFNALLSANGTTPTQFVINLIIVLFNIICLWIIFKKAGRKGREAIIPVWDLYIVCKIAGKKKRFWASISPVMIGLLWLVISLVSVYLIGMSGESTVILIKSILNILNWILGIASIVALILEIIAMFVITFQFAKKFGKTQGFGVGLLFLTPIFLGILAFGKAEYLVEDNQQ